MLGIAGTYGVSGIVVGVGVISNLPVVTFLSALIVMANFCEVKLLTFALIL